MPELRERSQDETEGSRVMECKLCTREGTYVATVEIPPFDPAPEALLWGDRCFVIKSRQLYYECFLYAVLPKECTKVALQ
jgi:hypothetical protein